MNTAPPRPALIPLSIAAGAKALLATAAIAEAIGPQVTGILLGVLLALDVGVAFYVQNRVVPLEDTVVYERAGQFRAGGAADQRTGTAVNPITRVGTVAGTIARD